MKNQTLETDYLIVGCGAAGMAFADSLIAESDAQIIMVDRRHVPGGHWLEAYPFVRLHQPSAFYGVNSMPLGDNTIDQYGLNAGMMERASGAEIVGYFRQVMDKHLLPSGKVRYFPMCDYIGGHTFVSRTSGNTYRVKVRKKIVDANYLQPSVPASYPPNFTVDKDVHCVTVNDITNLSAAAECYVIIGGGKTGIDTCLWLLENEVAPDDICWIRPRDSWLANRRSFQPGELAFESFSLIVQASAQAQSPQDFVARLTDCQQFFPMDEDVEPTMFKYATVNETELTMIRSIKNIVRLGRVQRIERDQIILEQGSVPTGPNNLHVHCAAPGLRLMPNKPIFTDDSITLQAIRPGSTPFAAAITAYIEATRDDTEKKNKLCPPNPFMDVPTDLIRNTLIGLNADYQWNKHPDIVAWLKHSRLNMVHGIQQQVDKPRVQQAMQRFVENAQHAVVNLQRLAREL